MPIPVDHEMLAHIRSMPKIDPAKFDEEALARKFEEDRVVCEAEYKKWLSYYDDDGHLKPGARKDPGYVAGVHYTSVSLDDDETAAFIAAEKKRLGVA